MPTTDDARPRRRSNDPDLRDPYDGIYDLDSVLAGVDSPESYYTRLFEWRTDLAPKQYLFTHVAPRIDGRFLAYPYNDLQSNFGIILDKNDLVSYLKKEIRKDDKESHAPLLGIITWFIFLSMILLYFFTPIMSSLISIGVSLFWILLREWSKKKVLEEFNAEYGKLDKYYSDEFKIIRPVFGEIIYKRKKLNSIYMDLFLSASALICVAGILYYFLEAENYFMSGGALIGLIHLIALSYRAGRSAFLIGRFQRNARRAPTHRDLVDLSPDAPRAPRFT